MYNFNPCPRCMLAETPSSSTFMKIILVKVQGNHVARIGDCHRYELPVNVDDNSTCILKADIYNKASSRSVADMVHAWQYTFLFF